MQGDFSHNFDQGKADLKSFLKPWQHFISFLFSINAVMILMILWYYVFQDNEPEKIAFMEIIQQYINSGVETPYKEL